MIRQILKSLLTPVLFLISSATCVGQFDYKIRKDIGLKGRVDSCVTNAITITYKDGKAKKQLVAKVIEYYDENGKVAKKLTYIFSDNPDTTAIKKSFITVYNYDKKGNFEEMVNYNSKGPYSKDVFTYTHGETGGDLKHYNLPDNKLLGLTKIKLNAMGDVEETGYHHKDSIYSAKPQKKINYEYNLKGYLIKDSASYSHTSRTGRNYYTYDKGDNLIQIRTPTTLEPIIQIYTYPKFDKLHNWLERDTFDDGKLVDVFERQITYRK
jgi:hypothetical protein